MRNRIFGPILLAALAGAGTASAGCRPPKSFVDTPHPAVAPADQLVSHAEDVDIARPLAEVLRSTRATPLQKTIRSAGSLPSVSGTYSLTKGPFGAVGTRQLDCLTDGSTLEEQVLVQEEGPTSSRFRYVVWNYTSDQARPIAYGVGEFVYTQPSPSRTHIHWTYSFALNRERFPGFLGAFGDFIFRITFLDRQYADLMRATLAGTKASAEAAPKS